MTENLWRAVVALQRRLDDLASQEYSHYRGTKGSDFNTTDLPQHGDYGYQTVALEIQFNCNGVIRAVSTAAL